MDSLTKHLDPKKPDTVQKSVKCSVKGVFRLVAAQGKPLKLVLKHIDGSHRYAACSSVYQSADRGQFDGWVSSLCLLSVFLLSLFQIFFCLVLSVCLSIVFPSFFLF